MEQRSFIELPRLMIEQLQNYNSTPRKDARVYHQNLPSPRQQRNQVSSATCVFKYPQDIRELSENPSLRQYVTSPRDNYAFYGDNSDWMIAERTKSRTPPTSPQTPSSQNGNICRASSPAIRIEESIHQSSNSQQSDDVVRCVPNVQNQDAEDETDHTANVQMTPKKVSQTFQDLRSPFQPMSRLSPRPFESVQKRENIDTSGSKSRDRVSDSLEILQREFERRNARKQLNFDSFATRSADYGRDELYYNSVRSRSPKMRRTSSDSEDEDDNSTSELISQLLSQLQSRKRKLSDRCRCDYDDDCDSRDSYKRRRKDCDPFQNMCLSRQKEEETRYVRKQETSENCACAMMEKHFLKMAENAYKNIRRQDDTAESFAQFRQELTETNLVLKESMSIMQNMRSVCEHRRLT